MELNGVSGLSGLTGLSPAGITPAFHLLANGEDITGAIAARFSSLRLTDGTDDQSDTLELVLADTDPAKPLRKPPVGAELQLFLGYDDAATYMGLYVCDEIRLGGWPGTMTLIGRAAVWAGTPRGKTDFQTQYIQSWKDGTTIGAMVRTMAKRHGMEAAVSASLEGVQLPHTNQDCESDVNLLLRLARRYDATVKIAGGVLVFAKRGEARALSGQALPVLAVTPADVSFWQLTESTRESAGTAVAFYHDGRKAARHAVEVGQGEPVRRVRYLFKSQQEALAAAKAALARARRGQQRLELRLQGHPELLAEGPLALQGFHPDVSTAWIVTQVVHSLSKGGGYTCEVEAELPNDPSLEQNQADIGDAVASDAAGASGGT
jgi:phage protein D